MNSVQQSPFSLSGQINMLINAVVDIDRELAIFTEEKKNSYETRRKGLKREQTKRKQQHKDEIIDFLRENPGSKITYISKYLDHERSLIFKRLCKLEADGVVFRVANGNILRWDLIK